MLDTLFDKLKTATDPFAIQSLEQGIWEQWTVVPDAGQRELMFRGIETVRQLLDVPVWVTCSTNAASWTRAGEIGANVLTIVQPLPTLTERIARYRQARYFRPVDDSE